MNVLLLSPIDPVIRSSCLTTTNTRIPMKNLVGYNIQNKPLFRVIAVRFLTIKGITICSDPSSQWAIKAMKYLDAKKKHQSAINSTTRVCSTSEKQVYNYTQKLTEIWNTTPANTGNKTEWHIPVTKLEQDWRGSNETTETFQTVGLSQEEEGSTIMNNSLQLQKKNEQVKYSDSYFCLKEEQVKYSDSYFCLREEQVKYSGSKFCLKKE
ncbi:uncharacterized protein LOC120465174 [Pimephales promelas]|uniref:uncharacterized protein LOC120465174 n=1 Tax=Pimephales promelas TaxID=90988 RepID=UPI001955F45E|nr:uncharacterized protein LOC120465174 [Pimephales promelas]